MKEINWFKIEAAKGEESTYHYIGSSSFSFEELSIEIKNGNLVRLDELLYMERGEIKEWAEWDKSLIPSVYIHPNSVVAIMQFKGDPRVIPIK